MNRYTCGYMHAYDRALRLMLVVLLLLPSLALGQADGSVPQSDGSAPQAQSADTTRPADATVADSGASGAAPASNPAPTPTPPSVAPATTSVPNTTSGGAVHSPTPAASTAASTSQPAAQVSQRYVLVTASPESTDTNTSPLLWPILAVLAIIPFGVLIAGWLRKKPAQTDESESRCFDIKQMMEEKLKELTDVKAMIKEKAIEKSKEAMRDAVSGTATGDLLVRAEKLEEQYKKLKALYEECQIDIDRYRYKGVLVENSLLNKEILNHVKIIRSREEGDWKLHDIRLSKKQIADIQQSIAETGWYFHLWEPGSDDVTVVFKDKLFQIKHSDQSTWKDAIAHGIEKGIPKEQLDFVIE